MDLTNIIVCRNHYSYPGIRPVERPMLISAKKYHRHMRKYHLDRFGRYMKVGRK